MSEHDGGPAFPSAEFAALGMSLRDYFAGQALSGLCANPARLEGAPLNVAVAAYRYADALLSTRAKTDRS